MRGSDLLDKLENLDMNLVAGAAAPPSGRARPKDRWWLPALTAAAACIVAIALPLTLAYLINGTAPTIEYGGPGANSRNTSHQASAGESGPEGGSGEGNARREPNKGGGTDGPLLDGPYDLEPKVSVAGYGSEYTWTRYTLGEDYTSVFDELPAEDYFKYNRQEPESMDRIRSDYDSGGSYILNDFDSYPLISTAEAAAGRAITPPESMVEYGKSIFSCLSEYVQPVSGIFKCTPDGSGLYLAQVSTSAEPYYDVTDPGLCQSGKISVLICQEPIIPEKDLAEGKCESDETVVIPPDGGEPITALGGLNTNRVLMCTLPNGMWCRIAGNFNVPYEDMVKLMNSLLNDTSVLDGINDKLRSGELLPVTTEEFLHNYSAASPSVSPDLLADISPVVYPYALLVQQ